MLATKDLVRVEISMLSLRPGTMIWTKAKGDVSGAHTVGSSGRTEQSWGHRTERQGDGRAPSPTNKCHTFSQKVEHLSFRKPLARAEPCTRIMVTGPTLCTAHSREAKGRGQDAGDD